MFDRMELFHYFLAKTIAKSKHLKKYLIMTCIMLTIVLWRRPSTETLPLSYNKYSPKHIKLEDLVIERMATHRRFYDGSPTGCNTNPALTSELQQNFESITQFLIESRQTIIPYAKDYFVGKGIVLTVGRSQIFLAKINVKLMELTGTRLPVQVRECHCLSRYEKFDTKNLITDFIIGYTRIT